MPAYSYIALDAHGRKKKGIIESDSSRLARQQLRKQSLTPLEIEAVKTQVKKNQKQRFFAPTLSASELSLLTRQLATLVRAALPLEESLQAVADQSESQKIKMVLISLRSDVLTGKPLASSLEGFPRIFPKDFVATVSAGEESGDLAMVLERLADHVERSQQLKQKIVGAMLYPLILSVVAILVVVGLLTFVVPQIIQVFDGMDQELPPLTQNLIATSELLQNHGGLIAIGLTVLAILINRLLQIPSIKEKWHLLLLKLPLASPLIRTLNSAKLCRTLSTLLVSGVPMIKALDIAAKVVTNVPMHQTIEQATQQIREGSSLSHALKRGIGFPPLTIHLIASGESSGQLDAMLEKAAETQERELEGWISSLLTLLEPLLLLSMGGIVLTIVLAIMLPIFNLNDLAG